MVTGISYFSSPQEPEVFSCKVFEAFRADLWVLPSDPRAPRFLQDLTQKTGRSFATCKGLGMGISLFRWA